MYLMAVCIGLAYKVTKYKGISNSDNVKQAT